MGVILKEVTSCLSQELTHHDEKEDEICADRSVDDEDASLGHWFVRICFDDGHPISAPI